MTARAGRRPGPVPVPGTLRDGPLWALLTGRRLDGLPAPGETRRERAAWRLHRLAWRYGVACGALAALIEGLTDPSGLAIVAVAAVISAAWLVWEWWRGRGHYREYVKPLYHRLKAAGVPLEGPPERHLHVPLDRSEVTVRLPHHWHAPVPVLDAAEKLIAATVAMGEHEVTRHLAGRKRHLKVTPQPLWPGRVRLAAIMGAIEKAPQWWIPIGVGRGDKPVGFQIAGSNSNPHGLLNGPSAEAGKSTTAKLIIAQWLRHGGVTVICDQAGLSHPWAHTFSDGGLPNAVVVRSTEDIAAMLVWLQQKMDDRVAVGLYAQRRSGDIDADLGVKILLCLEEMNSLMIDLKDYPDALGALLKLVCRGRHMGIHVMILAQRAEARTLAGKYGGQVRENLGWKLCGRGTSPATLKFVAEGLPYPPGGVNGDEGRYGAVIGRKWQDVQIAYATNQECWDLALSGTQAALPAGMPAPSLPQMPGGVTAAVTDNRGCALPAADTYTQGAVTAAPVTPSAGPELVSLSAYADGPRELARLRKHRARYRDRGFPEIAGYDGTTELFIGPEMDTWLKSR